MQVIWAEQALLGTGWARDVRIEVAEGRIAAVTPGAPAEGERVGVLVPAPANAHSHAFQRAMAGLTERKGPAQDSFWTWRQLMFRFLEEITPEQVQAIAAFVQMEMAEAGFGASVEFHYLHHAPGGAPYADLAEMSGQIAAAAETSRLGLTLLPVAYQFGGLDRRPLGPGQIRFGNDRERFARLHEAAGAALTPLPDDTRLGVALHSLRAVAPEDLLPLAGLTDGPIHVHLAEQVAEVDEVEAALGARPVAWALANLPLDDRWCLIHCTQMTPGETTALAAIGAVAGLCPLTEASLGDGIFDGVRWLGAGGAMAIGSDSNIRISLAEELRQLDTSQRLRDHSRAALATPERSTGRRLMEDAALGGAKAAGRGTGRIEPGAWADLLALDMAHPDLEGLTGDTALDSFVLAGGPGMVDRLWSAGRPLVTGGRHHRRDEITAAYRRATRELRARA
ncbi:formimidoylglutamate deiminase [Pseudoroseicyclus sp. H15]